MKTDKIYLSLALLLLLTVFSWITSCTHVANIADMPEVCFTGDVLNIFSNSCAITGCHDGGGESRMILNNYTEIMKGIVPFNPGASRFYQAIISKWGNMMPPNQPLTAENRTKIRVWIEQGAVETKCTDTTGTGGTGINGDNNNYVARACFARDIQPVIVSRCATTQCHDAASHKEGLNYTTYTGIMKSVRSGSPNNSKLYQVIKLASGESKMPPSGKPQLSVAEIDSIGKWIGYGALNESCGEVCDTINPVTFSGTIWPVIQSACTGCHSGTAPSGNVALSSYSDIATVASSGLLIKSLNGTGVTLMPPSGTLSACRKRQFQIWVNNGFLSN
jgi:hypothetical protein